MPSFEDLLSGISPETGYPDTFLDDARGAYEADMGGANAKIVELEAALAEALANLNAEKVVNYDLMRAGVANEPAEEEQEEDAEEPSDPESYDDLFATDDKEDS